MYSDELIKLEVSDRLTVENVDFVTIVSSEQFTWGGTMLNRVKADQPYDEQVSCWRETLPFNRSV